MGRSRLPLPSLLGLLGAFLMLSPELLTMDAKDFYNAIANQPHVQKALASAVEQYNQDRKDSANYFKAMRVPKAWMKMGSRVEYHFRVILVKTTCKKVDNIRKYEKIQECEQLPGNHKQLDCYFAVLAEHKQVKMNLEFRRCI